MKEKCIAQKFYFTYRYIDDVISLYCSKFSEYLEFYPRDHEINETSEMIASPSYLYPISTMECFTRLYDKRDDFNFPITDFPLLISNIESAPAYGVYVSQPILYAWACSVCQDFIERERLLTTRLLSQGYQRTVLVSTLKKFIRHHDLVDPEKMAVSRLVSDGFATTKP